MFAKIGETTALCGVPPSLGVIVPPSSTQAFSHCCSSKLDHSLCIRRCIGS
jgi:hypothetical protein